MIYNRLILLSQSVIQSTVVVQ